MFMERGEGRRAICSRLFDCAGVVRLARIQRESVKARLKQVDVTPDLGVFVIRSACFGCRCCDTDMYMTCGHYIPSRYVLRNKKLR